MLKLLQFLVGAFADKEGSTRASVTMISVLTAVYFLFVPKATYDAQVKSDEEAISELKAQQAQSMRLVQAQLAEISDTLARHSIYVPRLPVVNSLNSYASPSTLSSFSAIYSTSALVPKGTNAHAR